MNVRVLLFASYADALGADALQVDVPEPVRVRDVLSVIQNRAAHAVPPAPLVAVNAEYADMDRVLSPNDEVAIIPPVAGG
ncbi:MAG: MoaD/ThiS family protein [Gemmatimonadaceae bacterium]